MLILCMFIETLMLTLAASTYFATFGDSCSSLLITLAGGYLAIIMGMDVNILPMKT